MTIVITLPYFFDGEAEQIVQLLHSSVDLIHIRKPESKAEEVERLIMSIPSEYYPRLVLHDHHDLAMKYHLHGVHLNGRNPQPPVGWEGSVSKSCHSLAEVKEWKEKCDYVSLSPIFDSISKQGYHAAFSSAEIEEASRQGIIDKKVLALGGVTFNKIDDVLRMGFGGGMILGDAWKNVSHPQDAVALTIAGSDSSAGAGIQQDLKTMTKVGVYGATVITAITSQNTLGVKGVMPVPAEVVKSQLDAVLSDLHVTAIKIGMVPNAAIAHVIADTLKDYKEGLANKRSSAYKNATEEFIRQDAQTQEISIIYDPVMISTSGHRLMEEDCLQVVCEELLPLCTLVTPNIPEAELLMRQKKEEEGTSRDMKTIQALDNEKRKESDSGKGQRKILEKQGETSKDSKYKKALLPQKYGTNFLVKGGHAEGEDLADVLYSTTGESHRFPTKKIATHNLHGTGCTLSSAIASYLVKGNDLVTAISLAKHILAEGIQKGANAHIGKGNGPLLL